MPTHTAAALEKPFNLVVPPKEQLQVPFCDDRGMRLRCLAKLWRQDQHMLEQQQVGSDHGCNLTWSAAAGVQKAAGAYSSTSHNQLLCHPSQPLMLLLLRPAGNAGG